MSCPWRRRTGVTTGFEPATFRFQVKGIATRPPSVKPVLGGRQIAAVSQRLDGAPIQRLATVLSYSIEIQMILSLVPQ